MKLKFIWIGATKSPSYRHLEADYLSRLEKYCSAAILTVREGKKTDPRQTQRQLKLEASRVEKALSGVTVVVCLDEEGSTPIQPRIVRLVERAGRAGGTARWALWWEGTLDCPRRSGRWPTKPFRLGRMTLPHELARVVLLEQVFRAFCIQNRVPYHRG